MAEGEGFEPPWAVDPNGFQDRLVVTASITLQDWYHTAEVRTRIPTVKGWRPNLSDDDDTINRIE